MTSPRIAAPPSMTDDAFVGVLESARSPAAPVAATCYAVCLSRGVDPAIALAFFQHESSYGTAGAARLTRNWGNLRAGKRAYQVAPVAGSRGQFAWYHVWPESLMDFCELLRGPLYEGAGLVTVAQVIPKYAPSSDGNAPARYIAAVERAVAGWAAADPWDAWGAAFPLPPEQRAFAIPRRWQRAQPPLGPAIGPEVALSPGRAARSFRHGIVIWFGGDETQVIRPQGGG